MSNEKRDEIDSFEKFTVNGEYAYLFHEVIRAKALMWMIDDSLSTAYRLLNKAKIALEKPLTYKLTLGEFCVYYRDQRPEWLAYRFWRYMEGGK
ncbi:MULTISPECIES: hypothetical protein [unclassified Chitinophaga]|uniref:hypothetical protein n=1 Tax=unclassified Chitinophaga TaxID=2619133 RepID=UPI00117EA289|nr:MULTISPECIES: hypothetical protein [unclassified Chitinophaga]WPV64841.1 hypothetical protein QQL36_23850 [Chitinophaga sp. LS1]